MKVKYIWSLLLTLLFIGCDDSTGDLGLNVMPDSDIPSMGTQTFKVSTRSILADSVFARTSTAYLGKYTDPNFGIFEADFLAQFNSLDYETFPETLQNDEATATELFLYYNSYFGDSLNACRLRVDSLDRVLKEEDISNYYTSLNPANFYNENAAPLGRKAYTAVDFSIKDSIRNTSSYKPYVRVKLPTDLGTYIIKKYKENKDYFKNADAFIQNVFKGIYVRCEHGDGTILYIDQIILQINFKYLVARPSTGKIDSLVTGATRFSATEEVIQANHFQNKGKLKELIKEDAYTYVKSPAGIFTEATLPLEEINKNLKGQTLNSVQLTFTNYTQSGSVSAYQMKIPQYLLLIRKKEMYEFFEKNKLANNVTSYLVKHDATNNQYNFTNISQLITTCLKEKEEGKEVEEDWNKIVLIPVSVSYDNNENLINISNDLEMSSVKLKGGSKAGNELNMSIIYSKFN